MFGLRALLRKNVTAACTCGQTGMIMLHTVCALVCERMPSVVGSEESALMVNFI